MDFSAEPGAVPVGEYASLGRAQEHALVILAMELSCWLRKGGESGYVLLADEKRAPAIEAELAAYELEQREAAAAPEPVDLPVFANGAWIALLWASVLMASFILQGRVPDWTEIGASNNLALIEDGEWWRPVTAMFLHADLGHLMGNLAAGVAYAIMACRALGRVLAWGSLLAAGAVANTLVAWTYYPVRFSSIGASTAVFGALGVLTGYGFYVAFRNPTSAPWKSVVVPLGGGLALLGWFGTSGENTDLFGHLAGFSAGLVIGIAASWYRLRAVFRGV